MWGDGMIVLISPTKTMKHRVFKGKIRVPFFAEQTRKIVDVFQRLNVDELSEFYNASDNIVNQAHLHWQTFDDQPKTIALFAYQGEAFRNFDAIALSTSEILKVDKHLRICSALYGLLRPLDVIALYRLDLTKNLPELGNGVSYWRDVVTKRLIEDVLTFKHPIIVNCCSHEYTQIIDIDKVKTVAFWVQVNLEYLKEGRLVNNSMLAKAARGTLARELSLRPITSISQMNRYLTDYSCKVDKKSGIVTYTQSI
jgi:cytoplasmic iron level regulating protein YaaA (DUF328/UPF0246 family)